MVLIHFPFFLADHWTPSLLYLANFSLHCSHQSECLEHFKSWRDLGLHTKIANDHSVVSLFYVSPHVRESRFWNLGSGKILLVELGILGFGIWNTAQGIWNPINDWNSESKFYWQILESGTWNLESTVWNPESKTVLDSLTWGNMCLPMETPYQHPPPPWAKCIILQSGWRKNKPHQRIVIGNFLTFLPDQWQQ